MQDLSSTFACSNIIFMIDSWPCFCFYWQNFTLIHGQQQHAAGNSNGPWPVPWILWMLKHLQLNLQVLNGILKVIPEHFIKIYQRALGDVLPLSLVVACCFGHHSAFLLHSFMGYSLCLTLAKCLSLSKCLKMVFPCLD